MSRGLNRFEWFKAVLKNCDLSSVAKNVAASLALQFANDETGQINPSNKTLAECVGTSLPTIKRAIRELVTAGWLGRTEGRGRGNCANYTLLSPGKIVLFGAIKKEVNRELSEIEKGSSVNRKGVRTDPSHNKDQQTLNKGVGNPHGRPFTHRCAVIPIGSEAERAWDDWLAENQLPNLSELGILSSDTNGRGWDALAKYPPNQDDGIEVGQTLKWAAWAYNLMLERQEKSA